MVYRYQYKLNVIIPVYGTAVNIKPAPDHSGAGARFGHTALREGPDHGQTDGVPAER